MIPPLYEIANMILNNENSGGHKQEIKMYIIASGVIADFLINTLLTYLYVKGLYEFTIQRYGNKLSLNRKKKYNYQLLDDRINDLMSEATRFAVLFIFTWISNFIIFLAIIVMYSRFVSTSNGHYYHILGGVIALAIKQSSLLIAITLSWKFSHTKYEKVCNKCHICIKDCCEKLVKKNKELTIDDNVEVADDNYL